MINTCNIVRIYLPYYNIWHPCYESVQQKEFLSCCILELLAEGHKEKKRKDKEKKRLARKEEKTSGKKDCKGTACQRLRRSFISSK